jgi:hypothetical protein
MRIPCNLHVGVFCGNTRKHKETQHRATHTQHRATHAESSSFKADVSVLACCKQGLVMRRRINVRASGLMLASSHAANKAVCP